MQCRNCPTCKIYPHIIQDNGRKKATINGLDICERKTCRTKMEHTILHTYIDTYIQYSDSFWCGDIRTFTQQFYLFNSWHRRRQKFYQKPPPVYVAGFLPAHSLLIHRRAHSHLTQFPLFYWQKSRTFQDPHEKFSRTFSEPTNAYI